MTRNLPGRWARRQGTEARISCANGPVPRIAGGSALVSPRERIEGWRGRRRHGLCKQSRILGQDAKGPYAEAEWADLVLQSGVEDKMERAESANRGDHRHGRTRRWCDSRDGGGGGKLGWEETSYCQDTTEASGLWPRQLGGHCDPGGGQGAEAISPAPCEQGTADWPRATLDAKQGAELKPSSLVLACGSFTGSARFHEQPPHNYTNSLLVVTGHLLCCDDRSDGDSEQRTCVGRCYVVATYLEKRVKCQYPQTKLL